MDPFLKSIADYYYRHYKTNLSEICFVFPGRRAGLFFQKYLAEIVQQKNEGALFLPDIFTLEKFYETISGLETAENLELLFDLYSVYKRNPLNTASFDTFYQIGDTILSDFDDIDKYLVDAKMLFTNISDLNDLTDTQYSYLLDNQIEIIRSFWKNFNPKETTLIGDNESISFNTIFSQLPTLYKDFKEQLLLKGIGYEGIIQRKVVELITAKEKLAIKHQNVVFIGFNALNKCEKRLFEHLKKLEIAHFYWDYSPFLLETNNIGAKYINENLIDFPAPSDWEIPQYEVSEMAEITITSVASNAAQTKIVNHDLTLLTKPKLECQPIDIGVILADENLLLPTLYAIPEEFKNINITMGYPLKNSSITSLITQIILLHKNKQVTNGKSNFYYKNLLPILEHQLFAHFKQNKFIDGLKNKILSENIIRVSKDDILEFASNQEFKESIEFIKMMINGDELSVSSYLPNLLNYLYRVENDLPKLDREFIYHHFKAINKINGIIDTKKMVIDDSTWLRIYQKITNRISVPFAGEPLQGVQVMGLMETRALDFKHLVILSLNESVFPSTSRTNSFILYNLRRGYELPTIEHRDSIFAYYFFRLINRAKTVNLVYSTASTDTSAYEMSRFLYQLKYHYPENLIKNQIGTEQLQSLPEKKIVIAKTEALKSELSRLLNDNSFVLYPTTLIKYFQCKLSFYFSAILKLKELKSVNEEYDNKIFGLIFHKAMELLYANHLNIGLSAELFAEIWSTKNRKYALEKAFLEVSESNKILLENSGNKVLINSVLEKYMSALESIEKSRLPFAIIGLEAEFEYKHQLSNGSVIKMAGNIDRIDVRSGVIQIIDYKTGSATPNIKSMDELFEKEFKNENKAILQTLLYCMIYAKSNANISLPIQPNIVQTKKLHETAYNYTLDYKATKKEKAVAEPEAYTIYYRNNSATNNNLFDDKISETIDEIFVSNTPFTQTNDSKTCTYCPYKNICMR